MLLRRNYLQEKTIDTKEQVLDNLYALRAGLSVISQEYDKVRAIEEECGEKLSNNAESLQVAFIESKNGSYPELEKLQQRYEYDKDILKKLDEEEKNDASDNEPFDPKKWMAKRTKQKEIIDKNNKKAYTAYAHWLSLEESDGYFNRLIESARSRKNSVAAGDDTTTSGFSYKREGRRSTVLATVFLILAAILATVIAIGFATIDSIENEIGIAVFVIILFAVFFILGVVYLSKSKHYKRRHAGAVNKKDEEVQAVQSMLDKLPEVRAAAQAILKEKDEKIAPIKESCNEFYMALKKQFSHILDERDWQNLDLVVYELETRRADNIKEALQLFDRELQTERIQQTIALATEQICYELRRGFAELKTTIIECCRVISAQLEAVSLQLGEISGQLSELCDGVNMSNALQAKANVTSARLLSDVHALRNYQ